ncbi:MAG TPA: T9SS type A sorting domain-containing protein [Ignavibacteriaceae bacterium]|jgi:hypothetical protein|nr:T9SS type A sorting domain-containing protein [Ignavibacteriaceae bacterium]HOJ17465.1 T9SS type A sorting domain-containing protein [Ignavibacteriaceae bacterium]HPO54753.1 T9SS type A sorting domain-containing protein [Ignavibacteriaceae bacterium]
MQKSVSIIVISLFLVSGLFAQASNYFPPALGKVWTFKQIPLDTLDNPVDSLITYSMDSLAAEGVYHGLNAKHILSKTGLLQTIQMQPYTDTNYVNLNGSVGSVFFRVPSIEALIGQFDTTGYGQYIATLLEFYSLLKRFENWYGMYDFQRTVNQEYLIFQFDTTVTINNNTIPLRFDLKEKRLNDEIIFTDYGAFDCKKFQENITISYTTQIFPPPFPPLVIPIFTEVTYVWFALNEWEIRRETPANRIDLTLLGYGSFAIPGRIREIVLPISSVEDEELQPLAFGLKQNYPNPFNPSTVISYQLPVEARVTLEVFNITGEKVSTLINGEMNAAGYHSLEFKATALPSGVYFCELRAGDFRSIKKLLLVK